MADIVKPPFDIREEEDPFLTPPGQKGSYVDALAAAQCSVPVIRVNVARDSVLLIVLEVPAWTFR